MFTPVGKQHTHYTCIKTSIAYGKRMLKQLVCIYKYKVLHRHYVESRTVFC